MFFPIIKGGDQWVGEGGAATPQALLPACGGIGLSV